eukprot:CAMPEP_0194209192 /NCGR_PEP_ID=MMETSP0156-20130528/7405_1 /TAXON_ID=33649 /ORGANISM="Thalassionema nitzschioides, Strain L26-B" /LENGTH=473 /DNA_ID=CAMNT_0038936317 /DNA_START=44 /DNA_END=1462 /DNA_ORIENTATION=-
MSDDSDSDDDLFMNSGLNKSKSKEVKKRAARANLLSKVLEEDSQKRQRRGKIHEMLKEDENLIKEAEATLSSAQEKKEKEAERLREEQLDQQSTLDRKMAQDVETAKETEGSILLGNRPNIIKRVPSEDSQPKLNELLKKLPRNSSLRTFLESNREFVSLVLEQKKIVKKFDEHELPDSFLYWLWHHAIFDENLVEGAYETLIAYYTKNVSTSLCVKDIITQWNKIFIPGCDENVNFRDPDDSMLDVAYWLNLWAVVVKNTQFSPSDSSGVADSLVKLSAIVLSTQFYKQQSKLGVAWENVVNILLEQLKKQLTSHEWYSWRQITCKKILDSDVPPPPTDAEDSDDVNCLLSKALIVNAFLQINGSARDFGAELALQSFQQCFFLDDWNYSLSRYHQCYEWLNVKENESQEWKILSYIICCFYIILQGDERIQMNGPLVLACTKILQSCSLFGLSNIAKNADSLKDVHGIAQW